MRRAFRWKRLLRSGVGWLGLLMMLGMGLLAMAAPRLAPHDPYTSSIAHNNLPPMWVQTEVQQGLAEFPLGTDRYGRDILSRLLYGARTAVLLALLAVPLAALIGATTGLAAGYLGGRVDGALMLVCDTVQSLPGIMFLVIVVLILRAWLAPTWENGLLTLVVGFALVSWPSLARLVRINVLQIKGRLFVEAARALGSSPWQVITRHLLPNVLHIILVWMINQVPAVILAEAVLGYIGVGVINAPEGGEFTVVSWGGMFFSGRSALSRNPLMLAIPSACILLISLSFILLADLLNSQENP